MRSRSCCFLFQSLDLLPVLLFLLGSPSWFFSVLLSHGRYRKICNPVLLFLLDSRSFLVLLSSSWFFFLVLHVAVVGPRPDQTDVYGEVQLLICFLERLLSNSDWSKVVYQGIARDSLRSRLPASGASEQ